jgi:diaminohydroxyphosphoribosylaminopyrimidine deaminase/5-amino-6-(5-phosphoribosylamino)uracil reductase
MQRALELAALGQSQVAPNPMVGCVVVHEQRIVGEGWHRQFGEAHAEVNAIASVETPSVLPECELYVTLEPCNHFGKTPPCTNLILSSGIKKVYVASRDPHALVNGTGLSRLREAGVDVQVGLLQYEAEFLNRRFFTFHRKQRPYVILKFAQTQDGYLGLDFHASTPDEFERHRTVSGKAAQQLTHKWRSEEQAILAGGNTILFDNPKLTVREWEGRHPLRVVIDASGKLTGNEHVFDGEAPTVVFTHSSRQYHHTQVVTMHQEESVLVQVMRYLYEQKCLSVLVEGGAMTLQHFISANCWDEARIFTSAVSYGKGIKAPHITGQLLHQQTVGHDHLSVLLNPSAV